jgi:hypothetical protein
MNAPDEIGIDLSGRPFADAGVPHGSTRLGWCGLNLSAAKKKACSKGVALSE